ncbi:MAG: ABC transporter ATP-binding protein [Candidatus Dormibacteraeota bacterium]|nr:ABC transporter ATP-binding protein [Candidatus Dormibacteraeota bacterium]
MGTVVSLRRQGASFPGSHQGLVAELGEGGDLAVAGGARPPHDEPYSRPLLAECDEGHLGHVHLSDELGLYPAAGTPRLARQIPGTRYSPAMGQPAPRPGGAVAEPSAPGGPALRVSALTKRFGDRAAFEDVSFEVARGEVFGFLGPNGAGKTTTVRTLGTLIAPTSGSAEVVGIPLSPQNGEAIRRRISVMPENPGLYLRLTVRENLELFASLYGLRRPGARIAGALEAVRLADRSEDRCGRLSKGLRQRVGLARALLNDPEVMFLDEPTSGLDPVAAREVHELINGWRQRGVTVFLTTHRLEEAERLCDRVAILNTRLRSVGSPKDLRARLFGGSLVVETASPLLDARAVFGSVAAVREWSEGDHGAYVLSVADPRRAAPDVARAVVAAGADLVSLAESQHSLEDVYLQLIDHDGSAPR